LCPLTDYNTERAWTSQNRANKISDVIRFHIRSLEENAINFFHQKFLVERDVAVVIYGLRDIVGCIVAVIIIIIIIIIIIT
jgi:hypothetical protein